MRSRVTPPGVCDGRVAFVTGASRGIGAAIAQRLASAGAAVALAARSLDEPTAKRTGTLRDVVAQIEAHGGRALAVQCDVLDPESCAAAVARCRETLGPIDILVNNAATGPYRAFERLTARDFQLTFDGNVRAPLLLVQLVAPDMRARRRGWIVNISSVTAKPVQGPPYDAWDLKGGHHLYAASKAALDRLTQGLAAELHAYGIAVNTLAPVAAVKTASIEALGVSGWLDAAMLEPVEAIAEAALALCACDASLTGRVTYSLELLSELGREIRTLDGASAFEASAHAAAAERRG
jgi:NAD(P)-dependent dehydrogenase (short-subunit alcohol dehydrogenase family)